MPSVIMLSVIIVSFIMLSVMSSNCYGECRYAWCRRALSQPDRYYKTLSWHSLQFMVRILKTFLQYVLEKVKKLSYVKSYEKSFRRGFVNMRQKC